MASTIDFDKLLLLYNRIEAGELITFWSIWRMT
jgi:hypothetical protein